MAERKSKAKPGPAVEEEANELPERARRKGNRITRVYTRVGDGGKTQLVGGREVPKSHPRLEAYGTIDELLVAMGAARDWLLVMCNKKDGPELHQLRTLLEKHLVHLQNKLFNIGGDLATPIEDRWKNMSLVTKTDIENLEAFIEALNKSLPPLRDFILPGGHPAATALHTCRVICRRAERAIARLGEQEPIGETVLPFINRLSDAFFVMARHVQHALVKAKLASPEDLWDPESLPPPLP